MSASSADAARRFITLVDELYNARCALLLTAAVPRELLFAGADGPLLAAHGGGGGGGGGGGAAERLEALQFEGEAEEARSRRAGQ